MFSGSLVRKRVWIWICAITPINSALNLRKVASGQRKAKHGSAMIIKWFAGKLFSIFSVMFQLALKFESALSASTKSKVNLITTTTTMFTQPLMIECWRIWRLTDHQIAWSVFSISGIEYLQNSKSYLFLGIQNLNL